ncbi:MAG: trypsin-like serine protease [Deltaproteobacteria bacterium]|nr:trypsin-like serine protease [Deltaproteobacteria bacterium]
MKMGWMTGGALVLVLMGCGGPEDAAWDAELAEGTADEALQGGAATSGYAAVGLVVTTDGSTCTGTLVTPRVVLTAAHCAATRVEAFYTGAGAAVSADEGDLSEALDRMARHAVRRQAAHPEYDDTTCGGSPDVALLWLGRPVTGTRAVRLSSDDEVLPGALCTAVGFGLHGRGGSATYARKRSGREQVVALSDDSLWVRYRTAVADHGDSGGPLLCSGRIAGVVSCGDERTPRNRVITYARPQAVRAWMASTIRAWTAAP